MGIGYGQNSIRHALGAKEKGGESKSVFPYFGNRFCGYIVSCRFVEKVAATSTH